jgi:2-keto-4-pentenoate hydratase
MIVSVCVCALSACTLAAMERRDAVMGGIRALIQRARADRCPVPAPTAGGLTVPEAYELQRELFGERSLRGFKLGLVSESKRRQMGLEEPIFGRVAPEVLLDTPINMTRFIQPRMEPELAVVLERRVPADPSTREARVAIGSMFLAVDFLDSVWTDYGFGLAELIADNASEGGFVLSDERIRDPRNGLLRLILDGSVLTSGPVAELGDVTENVRWLASMVGGLSAGTLVFLGSPAPAVPVRPGILELQGPAGSALVTRIEGVSTQ